MHRSILVQYRMRFLILPTLLLLSSPLVAEPAWQWLEYPSAGAIPSAAVWQSTEREWTPPGELGWNSEEYTVLVMIAGSFECRGGQDALLERIGRISASNAIKYWSVTEQIWNTLFDEAYALESADESAMREDFTVAEVTSGKPLLFLQQENRGITGGVYRMRVNSKPGRIIVTTENVNPLKSFMISLIGAGEFQTGYILEQQSDTQWRYYSILRAGRGGYSLVIGGHDSSFINRANAMFRHLSGTATDSEPPLALK
ncbi:MAG: DUF6675 family protein [Pseudomonadota bacterium]